MWCASFILLAALGLSAQVVPTFRSDIALVHVDLEVTDGDRLLTGFQQQDFIALDNGRPQNILYFSQDEEPLDVILLFDISGSMRSSVARVAASAQAAFSELRPGDRVAVMTFHSRSRVVAPFSEDLASVQRAIQEEVVGGRFRGGTRLLAGVDDAAQYFLDQPKTHRRRAILILTDNFGQRSRRSSTVVHRLWEADASLSGLIIRGSLDTALNTASTVMNPAVGLLLREGMESVAEKTGGDTIKTDAPGKADDPGQAFHEMMHRIRLRYSLYYAIPAAKPGEERQVKIELTPDALQRFPKARVRARKGYQVPVRT
ncbi:MAG TPA: VWA domain-containing protein [Bryobacteraceae bacterium]|nr:VWA domain-containing protein [Bryobacteraceae bacterium]